MSSDPSKRARVLLVGWDSAGREMVGPMLDAQQLPNLSRFVKSSVMGLTTTHGPLDAPVIYNSVATGKYADKHGVLGPYEAHGDGTVTNVNSHSRRAKAFWEILSQNDRRCNVVNFPATGPAEQVNGVFVSPAFFFNVPISYRSPIAVPPDSVFPGDRLDDLKEFIVSLEDIDAQTMALFVPKLQQLEPTDERIKLIAGAVVQTLSVHTVATWLMENTEWDVMSVNYPAIDALWGPFMRYNGPRLDWVDQEEFELFNDVCASSIRLCDLLLDRLLELAGQDATVLLYSPRSYAPHDQTPSVASSGEPQVAASLYREGGIFAMRSPGVRKDELIHGVAAVDLCPTVLHLSGLAAGEDMDGRALAGAFAEPPTDVATVESWDRSPPLREHAAEQQTPEDWSNEMGFFASYSTNYAKGVRTDNDWRLARTLLDTFRQPLALSLLIRLYYTNPLQIDKATMVAEALYSTRQLPAAMAVMQPFAETFPDTPAGQFAAGLIALHQGHAYQALDLLEKAAQANPTMPQLFFYVGHVCLMIDRLARAEAAYRQAVVIDPNFHYAHLGLTEALHRQEKFEEAVDAALTAIGLNFGNWVGHVLLGKALAEMDQADSAKQAFQTALQFDPGNRAAQSHLAALEEGKVFRPLRPDEGGVEAQAGELPTIPAETREGVIAASAHAVEEAHRQVAKWHGKYVDDLAKADARLDNFLIANATARGVECQPEKASDIGGEWQDTDWTIRPSLPVDQPALCQMFRNPFADAHNQEAMVIHPTGTADICGGVKLSVADDAGEHVNLTICVGMQADTVQEGEREAFLMTRLLRAAVARAAAGGARRVAFVLSQEQAQSVLSNCLERLGFVTTMVEAVYIMDMATFRDRCLGLVERYRRRKKIPDDIRLVPLRDVPWQKVDQFLRQWFNDGAGAPSRKLSSDLSRVMLRGDEIVAAFVGHKKDYETFLVTRVGVLDDFRGLWVTPWLLGDGSQGGLDDGHTLIEFHTDEEKYPEFVKIARRMGAEKGKTMHTMTLELAIAWPREPT